MTAVKVERRGGIICTNVSMYWDIYIKRNPKWKSSCHNPEGGDDIQPFSSASHCLFLLPWHALPLSSSNVIQPSHLTIAILLLIFILTAHDIWLSSHKNIARARTVFKASETRTVHVSIQASY